MGAIARTIGQGRYVVPSAFTAASAACAVMSMQSTALPADPAWWILYSVLLDKLDGTAARLLKAQTAIGVQLDSLADLLAFGVAPAYLFYRLACAGPLNVPGAEALWAAIALFYALATAWRLHRFNKEASGAQSHSFRGMPSTMAGALAAVYVVTFMPGGGVADYAVLTMLVVVLGIAMNLNYRSRKMSIPRSRPLLVLQGIGLTYIYWATFFRKYPESLFVLALMTLAISIFGVSKEKEPADEPGAGAGE